MSYINKCFLRVRFWAACGIAGLAFSVGGAEKGVAQGVAPVVVGTVTDSAGHGLPNVQVLVTQLERSTSTDMSGRFRFGALPAGRYEVVAMRPGYAPSRQQVTIAAPAAGADTVRLQFTLQRSAVALDAVHVTGAATSSDARDVTQSTVQLSGAALARNLAPSVAQTLESQPGLSVRYNGPVAATPIIRGLSGDRILVLQNGERTGDLSAAAADHGLTIDPLLAQRIEVVRGPESLLYGSNALGGVVNVISNDIPTTVPGRVTGLLAMQGESVTPGGAMSGTVTVPLSSQLALSARGNYRKASDAKQGGGATLLNSFDRRGGGGAGLGYVGQNVTGGVGYEGLSFRYGLPGEPDDEEFGVYIRGSRHQATGRSDIVLGTNGLLSLHVDGTAQWYKHDEVESSGEIGTRFDLKTQTVNATARTLMGSIAGAVGVSGLFKEYASAGEEALTPAAQTKAGGLFVFQEIPLWQSPTQSERSIHLHVGARYDFYRVDSRTGEERFGAGQSLNFNSGSGSIGLVVPVNDVLSINGSVARAFRAPTVEELFSHGEHHASGTYDIGNAALKAEANTGAELVMRIHARRVNAQLSGYYNRIDNYVFPRIVGDTIIEEDGEEETLPVNQYSQARATLRGAEGSIDGEIVRHVVLGAMGDVVRGTLVSGESLPFMPAARLGAHGRYDDGTYSIGAEYRHGFKQSRVPVAVSEHDASAIATTAYDVVNLSLGYTLTRSGLFHTILLRVDNVFDEQYKDATSRIKSFANNPGRNVALVYKVTF